MCNTQKVSYFLNICMARLHWKMNSSVSSATTQTVFCVEYQGAHWSWKVLESPRNQLSPGKTFLENWKIEEKSWKSPGNFFFSKHNFSLILNFWFIKQKISEIVYFSGESFLWKIYFHELSYFASCTIECIELLIKNAFGS